MNPSPAKSALRRPAPPSGLGRGLARILETPSAPEGTGASTGLDQLLGPVARSRGLQLRPFILRAALTAVADLFRAEGAMLALWAGAASRSADTAAGAAGEPVMVTHLPPSWTANSGTMFELHGRLWSLSQVQPESENTWSDQYRIGDYHVWMARLPGTEGPVGVAFVRTGRFQPAETHALERSMASAVSALAPNGVGGQGGTNSPDAGWGSNPDHPLGSGLWRSSDPVFTASVTNDDETVVAEVTVRPPDGVDDGETGVSGGVGINDLVQATLIGTGRGPDVATAVAQAAANACQPQRKVSFAGSLDVDGSTVTVVLVGGLDLDGRPPRLGVSIRPSGDVVGAAEAVFAAARAD
jgi:hypothetical protein